MLSVRHRREHDAERAPLSDLRLELEPTAVDLAGPAGDRESKSGAAELTRSCFVHAVEPIEDVLSVLGSDSGPLVLDLEASALGASGDRDPDCTAFGRVLDRVVDEV